MIRLRVPVAAALSAALALTIPPVGAATNSRLSIRDSFRIGTAGVLCTAQTRPMDPRLRSMFDRGYAIVCRDAAASVGSLLALRAVSGDPIAAFVAARGPDLTCSAPAPAEIAGLAGAMVSDCTANTSKIKYRTYTFVRGTTSFIADGLGGYDSALKLGLQSLLTDRPVPGEVQVATTSAGDPAAFARVQAGTLDADSALAEAYSRNNSGSYAESAEFFETLVERNAATSKDGGRVGEYLVNQGLQQSNLGNMAAASALFRQAEERGAAKDPVVGRLLRNYRALDLINQRRGADALTELARPVVAVTRDNNDTSLASGVISPMLSEQINRENAALERLGGVDSRLRTFERAEILDGQAEQLRGVALRIEGKYPEARASLERATRRLAAVREGRVTSIAFLRSETAGELGRIAEAQGDFGTAERELAQSVTLIETDYPQSASVLAAKARLASYLARRGEADRAIALYAEVVAASERVPGSAATMRPLLAPYFALLVQRMDSNAKAAPAMFEAGQILLRPGIAQTQAVLARELSGGDDEASRLFRQSVTQSREISRATGEVARLTAAAPAPGTPEAATLASVRERLTALEAEQTAVQSRLGDYPRYRVLAPQALSLADLQKAMRPREAYYQLRVIGQDVYAMFVTPGTARAIKVAMTAKQLEDAVATLRASIVTVENGAIQTYPFDVKLSRTLYKSMFDPFGDALAGVDHLIFEPDGPMLQLPANLLVADQAGVDAYTKRLTAKDADEFDFTGIDWLGRDRDVSTAVSPRSFVDVRAVSPSKAKRAYLGLGQNAVPSPAAASFLRTSAPAAAAADCAWPIAAWGNPISSAELTLASQTVGASRSTLITGDAFSDSALKARDDLADYRVIHFATHGLVTAPRPECPARPALLTSFGDQASDGLLTFREIYDLRLDADVVVLSACDTAGMATVEATREAGIATGGNFALDGLVRAFVGAGARSVIASHWPIPDDYDATKRLILGLYNAPPGTAVATALRTAQRGLMDDKRTSHPFYWSAFAIVGDGERPMLRKD